MNVQLREDEAASRIAAAIGEPARARMLYCLMDGCARTSTELAVVANVAPPTASAHLQRLKCEGLIRMRVQGKHRYYALADSAVGSVLESLNVFAAGVHSEFVPSTPQDLRIARTCYDHMAGTIAVVLHDRFVAAQWVLPAAENDNSYSITAKGYDALQTLGVAPEDLHSKKRRLAYACLDWSERRPHIGGAMGAALLRCLLDKGWIERELHHRALSLTSKGRSQLLARFNIDL